MPHKKRRLQGVKGLRYFSPSSGRILEKMVDKAECNGMEFLVPRWSQFRRHNDPHITVGTRETRPMKSLVLKRSIVVAGQKTSISLEDEFWESLRKIAGERREPVSRLITSIDAERSFANLSSAVRMFILRYYRDQLDQQSETVAPLDLEPSNSVEAR
jgi:predicted DNA-binding ribbon-helix-helix protein